MLDDDTYFTFYSEMFSRGEVMDILGWILWFTWMVGIILIDYLMLQILWFDFFRLKERGWVYYENVKYTNVGDMLATGYLWR